MSMNREALHSQFDSKCISKHCQYAIARSLKVQANTVLEVPIALRKRAKTVIHRARMTASFLRDVTVGKASGRIANCHRESGSYVHTLAAIYPWP